MASVFDHLQTVQQVTRSVTVIGVDPDLHTAGVAIAAATWKEPRIAPPKIMSIRADVVRVPDSYTSVKASNAMAVELAHYLAVQAQVIEGEVLLVAEAQQVYADPDMKRDELVAKANDLLRLGQVTGVAQGIAATRGWGQLSMLPVAWKKQKDKAKHHVNIGEWIQREGIPTVVGGKAFGAQAKLYSHAIDAIGMVQWAVQEASSGRLSVYTRPT